jgi:TPR repeat protein
MGEGVLQDYEEAVKWYRLAAEQGDAGAQYQLALSYDKGHGVPQDYKEAVKWYRLAAKQELAVAQHNLGVSYAKGEGVIQNDVFGYMWLNIAATAGYKASAEDRSKLSARMTASDLSKARQLARECVKKEYKGC